MRDPNPKSSSNKDAAATAIPSSLSYFQAPLNIRQSNERGGVVAGANVITTNLQNSK